MPPNIRDRFEDLYTEIRRTFERSVSPLVRPVSQRGAVGFAALYTEPRDMPDMLLIGQNPGNFGPNDRVWDDEANRWMMAGRVPTLNSYLAHQHNFGKQLQHYFDGQHRRLLKTCVGMNVWFVQAKGTPTVEAHLATFCEDMARRMIRLLRPKTLLCLSQQAFSTLATGPVSTFGNADAPCKLSDFESIPMIYAHHPTGRWTRQLAAISIPVAIAQINDILVAPGTISAPELHPVPDRTAPPTAEPTHTNSHSTRRSPTPSTLGRSERTFRITPQGRAFLERPGRAKQLAAIVELAISLGGPNGDAVSEAQLVQRMGEHPVLRASAQTQQALLDWYRTHRLLPDQLAVID